MTEPEPLGHPEIAPENCPEPFWHDTHRYCPCCSWTEDYGKPPTPPKLTAQERQTLHDLLDRSFRERFIGTETIDIPRHGDRRIGGSFEIRLLPPTDPSKAWPR